jgi:hypothetical protein
MNNKKIIEINPGKEDQKAFIKLSKNYPINSLLRRKIIKQKKDTLRCPFS